MLVATDLQETRALGRPIRMTPMGLIRHMLEDHGDMVRAAHDLYMTRYHEAPTLGRIAGADTGARMANRLGCGLTVERAAWREFDYRLSLALRSRVFPSPCIIGM